MVSLRDDQPVSWVGAFERPVRTIGSGVVEPSVAALVDTATGIDDTYGHPAVHRWASALPQYRERITTIADVAPLPATVDSVIDAVADRITGEQ